MCIKQNNIKVLVQSWHKEGTQISLSLVCEILIFKRKSAVKKKKKGKGESGKAFIKGEKDAGDLFESRYLSQDAGDLFETYFKHILKYVEIS